MPTFAVRQLGPATFTIVNRITGATLTDLFVGVGARERAEHTCAEANKAGHPHEHIRTEAALSDCAYGCNV